MEMMSGFTYASHETSQRACRIVLWRVQLNLADFRLCSTTCLFKLLDSGIAQLVRLLLCVIGDTPGAVELRTRLILGSGGFRGLDAIRDQRIRCGKRLLECLSSWKGNWHDCGGIRSYLAVHR
jgi:hypothetical protein